MRCTCTATSLGGSWTGNSKRPSCRVFWKRNQWFERTIEKKWRREDEFAVPVSRHHRWKQDQNWDNGQGNALGSGDQDECNAVEA